MFARVAVRVRLSTYLLLAFPCNPYCIHMYIYIFVVRTDA